LQTEWRKPSAWKVVRLTPQSSKPGDFGGLPARRRCPQTPKQEALHTIERLPDDVPLDEIVYRLYLLSKVQQGLKDIDTGHAISSDDLAREIEAW